MFLVVLISVLYAYAEGNGIVKSSLGEGDSWPDPPPETSRYIHHLECDCRHMFPRDDAAIYTYDLHCEETTDQSGKAKFQLVINYDRNMFDIFEVTTCDPEKVVSSIFPPKEKDRYQADVDEPDEWDRPTVTYLKYRNTEGKCFVKKYKFKNRASEPATRFTEEMIQCEGESGPKPWTTYGEVSKFINCRVNNHPMSGVVLDYSHERPDWTDEDDRKLTKQSLLTCTFDQYSRNYKLICIKGDSKEKEEYFATVTYSYDLIDRFTVKSCKEEDIVYGIFPLAKHFAEDGTKFVKTIWFSKSETECFYREYPRHRKFDFKTEAQPETCPTSAEQWTNPTWKKVGKWRECYGPMSVNENSSSKGD